MECALADILRDEHNSSHNADIIAEKWEILPQVCTRDWLKCC